jgi:hypothetical protein
MTFKMNYTVPSRASRAKTATLAVGGLVLALALAVGAFLLAVWVLVWNINDMIDNGVNFWNVFWSLLALAWTIGGTGRALS